MFTRSRPIIAGILICAFLVIYLIHDRSHTRASTLAGYPTANHLSVDAVVVQLKQDDITWHQQYFPEWHHKFYVVDDPAALLTVEKNKGRESMAYLTYIIDHYATLSDIVIFMHAERWQWHNDDPDLDGVGVLSKLQLTYVKQQGYVNLRCVWNVGCPAEIRPFAGEVNVNHKNPTENVYKKAFEELFPGIEVPKTIGVGCCAQFAVSRERILQRSRDQYIGLRTWLLNTELSDHHSGRVFEYSWHMIFGMPARYCPPAEECYCKTFGLCGLKCGEGSCAGRYSTPPLPQLPQGWPYRDWDGSQRQLSNLV